MVSRKQPTKRSGRDLEHLIVEHIHRRDASLSLIIYGSLFLSSQLGCRVKFPIYVVRNFQLRQRW
jgi:hypothetical protein